MTNLVSLTVQFHPLHPNISIHILNTLLFIFPKVLTGRICRYISIPRGGIQSPLSALPPYPTHMGPSHKPHESDDLLLILC